MGVVVEAAEFVGGIGIALRGGFFVPFFRFHEVLRGGVVLAEAVLRAGIAVFGLGPDFGGFRSLCDDGGKHAEGKVGNGRGLAGVKGRWQWRRRAAHRAARFGWRLALAQVLAQDGFKVGRGDETGDERAVFEDDRRCAGDAHAQAGGEVVADDVGAVAARVGQRLVGFGEQQGA